MNKLLAPAAMATAVAAASVTFSGTANAQFVITPFGALDEPSSLLVVPYYTVREAMISGIIVTNTSPHTQVVKVRLRRGTDSMDALDFNLIMSPFDQWTGFISDDEEGTITFRTTDNTCTAPVADGGVFTMPDLYREGADEGYIEIIGMGATIDEDQPIAIYAKHDANGEPLDCNRVAENFFANVHGNNVSDINEIGVIGANVTNQSCDPDDPVFGDIDDNLCVSAGVVQSIYNVILNPLSASYFIRNDDTGTEFGNRANNVGAVPLPPSITNQETGIFSGDLYGFDFPDLDGGAPPYGARGFFELFRSINGAGGLGLNIMNSWSANPTTNLGTDWVVTLPGQYLMVELIEYFGEIVLGETECNTGDLADENLDWEDGGSCDFRDIPVKAAFTVYDREERGIIDEPGELVVSPSLPGEVPTTLLPNEVNVIEWGNQPVLHGANPITVETPEDALYGWASLAITPNEDTEQAICNWVFPSPLSEDVNDFQDCYSTETAPFMLGFVAWQRSFPDSADASYGRLVDHVRSNLADLPAPPP